jgi:hypothetical protein
MIARLRNLKTIIIDSLLAVPSLLQWWKEELDSPSDPRPCFPSLERLVFHNVLFVRFEGHGIRLAPFLIEILEKQASSLHPLQNCTLKRVLAYATGGPLA